MKIIIDKGELNELIINHVGSVIGDKAYKIIGELPESIEIMIAPGATLSPTPAHSTVGSVIQDHTGPDAKVDEPKAKRTRRSPAEMIADGDRKAANPEEQAAADKILAARAGEQTQDAIEAAGEEDATVEEIKTGLDEQTDLVEETPAPATNSNSIFDDEDD